MLKEGVHYGEHNGFGWKHIWEQHKENFRDYYENLLGRKVSDDELKSLILEDIEKTLRYGEKTDMPERQSVVYNYEGIEVVISTKPESSGSIITAHPGD